MYYCSYFCQQIYMEANLKMWNIRSERNLNDEPAKFPLLKMEKLKHLKRRVLPSQKPSHWKSKVRKQFEASDIGGFSISTLKEVANPFLYVTHHRVTSISTPIGSRIALLPLVSVVVISQFLKLT